MKISVRATRWSTIPADAASDNVSTVPLFGKMTSIDSQLGADIETRFVVRTEEYATGKLGRLPPAAAPNRTQYGGAGFVDLVFKDNRRRNDILSKRVLFTALREPDLLR